MHMQPGCSRWSVRYSRVPARRELIVSIHVRACLQTYSGTTVQLSLNELVHFAGRNYENILHTFWYDTYKMNTQGPMFSEFPRGVTKQS